MPLRACHLVPLILLLGCPGSRTPLESDATQCKDGRDNDGDGLIDCKDPDCSHIAYCSATLDGQVPVDGAPKPDGPPTPDQFVPRPDLVKPSSYGKRCTFSTPNVPCPDGETVCVPANYGPGFCTYACPTNACPPGPTGTQAQCAYRVDFPTGSVWFCIFLCQTSSCPHDTACFGSFCY